MGCERQELGQLSYEIGAFRQHRDVVVTASGLSSIWTCIGVGLVDITPFAIVALGLGHGGFDLGCVRCVQS